MIRTTVQQGAKTAAVKAVTQPSNMASRSVSTIPQRLVQDELVPDLRRGPHEAAKMLHMRRQQRVQSNAAKNTSGNINPGDLVKSWPKSALDTQLEELALENPNFFQRLDRKAEVVKDELKQLQEALSPPVKPQCEVAVSKVLGEGHHSTASTIEKLRLEIDEMWEFLTPPAKAKEGDAAMLKQVGRSLKQMLEYEVSHVKRVLLVPSAKPKEGGAAMLKSPGRSLTQVLNNEVNHMKRVLMTPDHWIQEAQKGAVQFKPVPRTLTQAIKKEIETPKASTTIHPPAKSNYDAGGKLLRSEGPAKMVNNEQSLSMSSKSRQDAIDEMQEKVNEMNVQQQEKAISAWC